MNRAEKTKQYLLQQLEIFKGFKSLELNKDKFFDNIKEFKEATILSLRKTGLIGILELKELEEILSELEKKRTKGGTETMVYWGSTTKGFTEVQSKLSQLALKMDNLKLPLRIRLFDYSKNVLADPHFARAVIAAIIGGLIVLLFNCLF
ncbi:MAG: hypothetical protein RBG1_1C00001G0209 [candidate division Zixibacteria bacterium RBG-1]|nr:MAG: hypothetical protein RBG1_1C00001G0209 [candidate division Zixibacteria bacterium RBG-1]OGC83919.1 MAG: hypothetical protein A2V73_03655 [candidate division Zixibacteria bacterium RBG_19FT_COMBO_42_43]